MRAARALIAIVVIVAACSSQAPGTPNGWAGMSYQGVHWSMPANPQVKSFAGGPKAAGEGQSYGHNAIKADGTLDPLATFNVFVLPLTSRPTEADLMSLLTDWGVRNGLRLSSLSALPSPLVGHQATFHEPRFNLDGAVRSIVYGSVWVIAMHAGDVGANGSYFMDSFGPD